MANLRETQGYIQAVGTFAGRAYSDENFKPKEHIQQIREIVEENEGLDKNQNEFIIQEVITGLHEIIEGVLPIREQE